MHGSKSPDHSVWAYQFTRKPDEADRFLVPSGYCPPPETSTILLRESLDVLGVSDF